MRIKVSIMIIISLAANGRMPDYDKAKPPDRKQLLGAEHDEVG